MPSARAGGRQAVWADASQPVKGWRTVIARLNGGLTPAHTQAVRALGGYVYRNLPLIGSAAVRIPNKSFAHFAALPFVTHISPDDQVRKNDEYTVGATGAGVAFAQNGLTGAGVTVAVLDSGVRVTHPDLADPASGASRVIASVNFASDAGTTDDLCGHGTHVAGIIAGNGTRSTGSQYSHTFDGIARGADIVSVRTLDANGQGAVSDVIRALGWVVQNKNQYHIRVINLSLGHPVGESYTTDPLCQAVEAAWNAGIVVVCAAGNDGRLTATQTLMAWLLGQNEGYGTNYGSIQSPGNDPDVITVGALKQAAGGGQQIATYSSRGPSRLDFVLKPDIVAPGNQIVSLKAIGSTLDVNDGATNGVPVSSYEPGAGGGMSPDYFVLSGTSMATPVVSGAAALLLQADPSLTPDTVKARLMLSADKWNPGQSDSETANAASTGSAEPVTPEPFASVSPARSPKSVTALDATASDTTANGSDAPQSAGPDPLTYGAGALDISAALACPYTATMPAQSPALWWDPSGLVHIGLSTLYGPDGTLWGTGVTDPAALWGSQVIWGEDTLSESQVIWGESIWGDQVIWGETATQADLSSTVLNGE